MSAGLSAYRARMWGREGHKQKSAITRDRRKRGYQFTFLGLFFLGFIWIGFFTVPLIYKEVKTETKTEARIEKNTLSAKIVKPPFDLTMETADFFDISRRIRHRMTKRGSESQWLMYGVARLDSHSFYLSLWAPKNKKSRKRDIRKKLKRGYNPLTDWGKVKLKGDVDTISTRHGNFNVQRFIFHSNARPRMCAYFQSAELPNGLSSRGHHCVSGVKEYDLDYLACKLSSLSSQRHGLLPSSKQMPCNVSQKGLRIL